MATAVALKFSEYFHVRRGLLTFAMGHLIPS